MDFHAAGAPVAVLPPHLLAGHDAVGAPRAIFTLTCVDAEGREKWSETVENLVFDAGRTALVNTWLKGAGYTAAWFLVLKGVGSVAAADTLAAHAGWTELTPYAGANRAAITWGTTADGSNTSTPIALAITGDATVAGAGISQTQVKATTTGLLYNMADFSTPKGVSAGDTLNVTVTVSAS